MENRPSPLIPLVHRWDLDSPGGAAVRPLTTVESERLGAVADEGARLGRKCDRLVARDRELVDGQRSMLS